jgi:hypothetical protein
MGDFAGSGSLSGTGTLGVSGILLGTGAQLSGSGTLQATIIGTQQETATFVGSGTLTAASVGVVPGAGALSGQGTLGGKLTLGFKEGLSGVGTLGLIGAGGVAASAGFDTTYAFPGTSQVAVAAPGSSFWYYLGSLGVVTALTYSFVCPGGCDQMTATIMVPAEYRTQLFDVGWRVRIYRGGHTVWTGKLDEPQPSADGWTLTAVGDGNRGTDFVAYYTDTWPIGQPDEAVNLAIARGLPWNNPGIGTPSGMWLGQEVDSGAQTVTDLLNLVCTRGGLTWYVNSQPGGPPGPDLSVFPLPMTVNRVIVSTNPAPRSLGGDINTIFIRYEVSAASSTVSGSTAIYGTTMVQNAASVAAHGELEAYLDLSSANVMTQAAAQAVGNYVLGIYQRASFTGPFTGRHGQLLNVGGQPIDPGTDQAGTVARLVLTDFAYGGEVTPQFPVTFIVGNYGWDDFAQQFTATPYQALDESISGLLSMESTVLTPITTN